MWRLAGYVYRAFRNTAVHRCSQDSIIPLTTVCNNDDDSNKSDEQNIRDVEKLYCYHALKQTQFDNQSLERLNERVRKISSHEENQSFTNTINRIRDVTKRYISRNQSSTQIPEIQLSENSSPKSISPPEETLESLLKADETCVNIIKDLTELHENTKSIINNQLAIDAFDAGNDDVGIAMLQESLKNDQKNPTALFNLAICYERGIGVEQDHKKACDHYRKASLLGHLGAQFNLSLLSNHIDVNESDDEDEITEKTTTTKIEPPKQTSHRTVRFTFATDSTLSSDDQQYDYHFDLNRTIACL